MKKFIQEFKEFALKGSVIDLAVGVIIGAAFQSIINSLVNDIIMPAISILTGGIDFSDWALVLGEGENAAKLTYGNFLSAVINFFIMAIVIFCFVKAIAKAKNLVKKPVEEAPTTKTCPFCQSEISIKAIRCPHCTSKLEE